MARVVTKAEAVKRELKTYDGEPCKYGHSGKRFVKGGKCVECNVERTKKFREKTGKGGNSATKGKVAVVSTVVAAMPATDDWQSYADKITATWKQVVANIITTGKLLIEAKAKLKHGEFGDMLQLLPFGERTAEMLMAISRHPVLSNPNRGSDLPPSWRTLYELSRFDDELLVARIEDHTIHPDMQRKDVKLITDQTGERSKPAKRAKANPLEATVTMLGDENRGLRELNAELQAAREAGLFIEDTEDDARLAENLIEQIGEERMLRLMVEFQRLLGTASEAAA
jgi:Protein of unknown function (DUF3102)